MADERLDAPALQDAIRVRTDRIEEWKQALRKEWSGTTTEFDVVMHALTADIIDAERLKLARALRITAARASSRIPHEAWMKQQLNAMADVATKGIVLAPWDREDALP